MVTVETDAGVVEHTGSFKSHVKRLPGRGHILAKLYRASGLALNKEDGKRGVLGRGISSRWEGPEMRGNLA